MHEYLAEHLLALRGAGYGADGDDGVGNSGREGQGGGAQAQVQVQQNIACADGEERNAADAMMMMIDDEVSRLMAQLSL